MSSDFSSSSNSIITSSSLLSLSSVSAPGGMEDERWVADRITSTDVGTRLEAAREIRRLTKTCSNNRRLFSSAIGPLVHMLGSHLLDCNEVALLALLNLAVRDERNKIKIVEMGALLQLIRFLQSQNSTLQEYATGLLLTLTASSVNKQIISTSGVIPLLVRILQNGNSQAKVDAVAALHNLSTLPDNLGILLASQPIPPIITLLNSCKKSSKTAEKCSALLESLLAFEEARDALTSEEGGVLSLVEVLEDGSLQSREYALSSLLTMCESDRCRYRELILNEGAIPGLLELTVQASTPNAQAKAHTLLRLLRKSPYQRSQLHADTLENIVCNIVSHIEGTDRGDKAKKMLAEMVQVSMEQSLRHLQQRALVCTPTELPMTNQIIENWKQVLNTNYQNL